VSWRNALFKSYYAAIYAIVLQKLKYTHVGKVLQIMWKTRLLGKTQKCDYAGDMRSLA